jgi:hypothetical protein
MFYSQVGLLQNIAELYRLVLGNSDEVQLFCNFGTDVYTEAQNTLIYGSYQGSTITLARDCKTKELRKTTLGCKPHSKEEQIRLTRSPRVARLRLA